jgi:hypothetical protein
MPSVSLVVVLLTLDDQLVDEFFGLADGAITVAMSANHFLGLAYFHHPHPTRKCFYNLKHNTSVLH